MFSASTIGLPNTASWLVSISARRTLRASATWTIEVGDSPSTSTSRVMRSSSLIVPSSAFTPGVSMMSQTSAPTSARPCRHATVVPGIVRDGDVAAGQPAEDDALADVRLTDQRDPQRVRAQA